MDKIIVEHEPSQQKLQDLAVNSWSIWTHEADTFPWSYDQVETCYILEGQATIKSDDKQQEVTIRKGDLVTFPVGLTCTWTITDDIKKHYKFS